MNQVFLVLAAKLRGHLEMSPCSRK